MNNRRNLELLLLAAAAVPALILFAIVGTQASGDFSLQYFAIPLALLALFGVSHLVIRFFAPKADPVLLPLVFVLTSIGIAFIIRLIPERAMNQIIWLFISVIVMAVTLMVVPSLEKLGRYKYLLMISGLILMISPALIGQEINGSKLWLVIPGVLSIQPGEIARVLIILFLAAYLAENREMLTISTKRFWGIPVPSIRTIAPLVFMWAISFMVLIFEKDLGSSLLFFCIFLVMLYTATGRISYVVVGLGLFSAGATLAYSMFSHVQVRVAIWLDPFADAVNKGYQLVQSLFAFAAGGLFGVGPGAGLPKRIPHVDTDFIFAAIGEEIGLLGAVAVLICFLVFAYRGLACARRAKSDMAAMTATGLTASIVIQTFVIIGGVTALIPLTGITIPFMSRGGSSLLSSFVLLALLLRASDESIGTEAQMQTVGGAKASLGRIALTKRLSIIAGLFTLLMGALIVNLTWIQVINAGNLKDNPANTRGLAAEQRVARGSILTRDNVVLAKSKRQSDDTYKRLYPKGQLGAHSIGYYSYKYGRSGIESAANTALTGKRTFDSWTDVIDAATNKPIEGDDVVLTLDSKIQKAASNALSGYKGACVVLDPRSGAVLASVSNPSYNPQKIDADWDTLNKDTEAPLLDRSRQTLLAPGSTFKVVTLAAALSEGTVTLDTKLKGTSPMKIGGAPVTNFDKTSYGRLSIVDATAKSANTVYGQMAVKVGAAALVSQSEKFGFNKDIPYDLPIKNSLMPIASEMTEWETAWAGCGQPVGEHESPPGPQATVFEMALVTAGIANGGVVMQPHLINHIKSAGGGKSLIGAATERRWLTAMDEEIAIEVTEAMVAVVKRGSGGGAAISNVSVAGKTGTAEVGKDKAANAWFIAFAPAENPTVALAIMLEGAGQGGRYAAPAAAPILRAALKAQSSADK